MTNFTAGQTSHADHSAASAASSGAKHPVSVAIPVRPKKIRRDHVKGRLIALTILAGLLLLAAAFADRICPNDPYVQDLSIALQAPSAAHIMGTDEFGRDMLSRVLIGGRTSIFATLLLVAIIAAFGTAVGLVCGYCGGLLDSVVMRISDFFLAFPGLVFAMAVAALFTGGIGSAVVALALISWPKYARVARGQTLSVRENTFVSAARLAGDTGCQLIFRHILPNVLGPILVTAMLDIGTMMMELAGLSFLGLGAQPPTAEWGNMMSSGRSMLQITPWVVLSPGIAIFITVAVFNLLGDTVRDYLDPKNSHSR